MSLVSVNENLEFLFPQVGHHRSDALSPLEQSHHLNVVLGLSRNVPVLVLCVVTVGAGANLAAPAQSGSAAVTLVRRSHNFQLSP